MVDEKVFQIMVSEMLEQTGGQLGNITFAGHPWTPWRWFCNLWRF